MMRVRPAQDPPVVARGRLHASSDLDALADRVRRLRPSHRDPEAFHVEKDDIERALRRLARQHK